MPPSRKKPDPSDSRIFTKPGLTGHRLAYNPRTGTVIEEDGKAPDGKQNKYFLYVWGRQFPIITDETLEELTGMEAPAEVTDE